MRHRHNEIAPSEFSCLALARPPHALVADAVFLMNFKEAAAMTIASPCASVHPSPRSLEVILNLEIYSDFSVSRRFEGGRGRGRRMGE